MGRHLQFLIYFIIILVSRGAWANEVLDNVKNTMHNRNLEQSSPTTQTIEIHRGQKAPAISINNKAKSTSFPGISVSEKDDHELSSNELLSSAYQALMVGHYEAAAVLYKKAVAQDPNNVNAIYALGTIYQKQQDLELAKQYYTQVLSQQPSHQKALNNFLTILSADKPEAALHELLELEQVMPNFAPIKAQIGLVYAAMNDYTQGERYIRYALSLSPQEGIYKYNLAVLYDKMQKPQLAIKFYQQALEAKTQNPKLAVSEQKIYERLKHINNL
jgi:Tfp pilus assembly protein PilF